MKKIKNKGFWVVYIFFLITITLSFWVVILNKQSYFEKNLEYTQIQDLLSKNILTNSNLTINYNKENNSNTWLYIPFLSCPQDVKYYSWTELLSTGKTIFENNFCSWSLWGEVLNLFHTWTYSNFWSWKLWVNNFTLYWTDTLTWDLVNDKKISFLKTEIFDDRFVKARLENNWIIIKNTWYQNIFWSNTKIKNFIDSNVNNINPFLKLSNTQSWVLYFDINDSFSWKIIEFDKDIFNNSNKLIKKNEINFSSIWWIIWYLQDDLSFSSSILNPKIFDFSSKDYAIFLSYNTWSLDNIRYKLKIYSNTQTWVYINPLKDDVENMQYLWNNIIINNWQFYNKIYKVIDYK